MCHQSYVMNFFMYMKIQSNSVKNENMKLSLITNSHVKQFYQWDFYQIKRQRNSVLPVEFWLPLQLPKVSRLAKQNRCYTVKWGSEFGFEFQKCQELIPKEPGNSVSQFWFIFSILFQKSTLSLESFCKGFYRFYHFKKSSMTGIWNKTKG